MLTMVYWLVSGAINSTACNIEVHTLEAPPLPTVRQLMNPRLENTVYDTDNMFQRDWLSGMN